MGERLIRAKRAGLRAKRAGLLASALIMIPFASAAATQRVWITELSSVANAGGGALQMAKLPAVAKQQVDTTGGVQSSAAFNGSTRFIRVVCEVQCAISGSGTATATDLLLPAYT